MKRYRFEIVRRSFGRFGWILIRIDDRGRRVLARSERSYGSRRRVEKAIKAVKGAEIAPETKEYVRVQLAATRFEPVSGVVPLIIGKQPVVEYEVGYEVRAKKRKRDGDNVAAAETQQAETGSEKKQTARLKSQAEAT